MPQEIRLRIPVPSPHPWRLFEPRLPEPARTPAFPLFDFAPRPSAPAHPQLPEMPELPEQARVPRFRLFGLGPHAAPPGEEVQPEEAESPILHFFRRLWRRRRYPSERAYPLGSYYVTPPAIPVRGVSGVGFPYGVTGPYLGVGTDMVIPLDPVEIAAKVKAGQALSEQERLVWNAQSSPAKAMYLNLARQGVVVAGSSVAAQQEAAATVAGTTSWLDQSTILFGTRVRNSYLAAGIGVVGIALILGSRRR